MAVQLVQAAAAEINQLWEFQQASFKSLYDRYQDASSPYLESQERLAEKIQRLNNVFYWIEDDGKKVGFVRIVLFPEENRIWLSPLLILPACQKKCYGRQTILILEDMYSDFSRWLLSTIFQEHHLVRFCRSLGYQMLKKKLSSPAWIWFIWRNKSNTRAVLLFLCGEDTDKRRERGEKIDVN